VLELVRVTGVFGETKAFVRDPDLMGRLAQWPVAVVLSEVYRIEGEPLLIKDLGFADKNILNNAYDGVRRDETYMAQLWEALRNHEVTRRWDVLPLPGFRDQAERDPALAKAVKALNRARNGGRIVCEGCDFSDESGALFDAHHRDPLGKGPRWSKPESFAVLCPTCHRWCHCKAVDVLQPLAIPVLRAARFTA
jgi:hypothetical protein